MADTFTVERRTHVEAPPAAVLERVVDFHRWAAWSPRERIDPSMRRSYAGADAGVGAVYEWEGNRKAGKGRMQIIEADDEHVTVDLRFDKRFPSQNTTTFRVRPTDGGSHVSWTMVGPSTLLIRLMGLIRPMDRMIGPDFEKGSLPAQGGRRVALTGRAGQVHVVGAGFLVDRAPRQADADRATIEEGKR